MRPSEALECHRPEIRRIVERNRGKNPRVFGSVLTHEDTEESDLDLLIDTVKGTSLLDLGAMQCELKELLGVEVQVVTPLDLPKHFRDQVVSKAVSI